MLPSKKNILIIMTGSIACYKACGLLSLLNKQGYDVKVVMSKSSLEFVGPATIEGLTGHPALTDIYATGHMMDHIHLSRWADLILVVPATAHYINRIASGIGDDLLTTLFLAHDFAKPFVIAPAMNTKMYEHPITQNSIISLKKMGCTILDTGTGTLACGEEGSGRLAEPEFILKKIEEHLQIERTSKSVENNTIDKNFHYKVLITGGGTIEPIDDVRVITNRSTGKTASQLADKLFELGFDVTYMHSSQAVKPNNKTRLIQFESFQDLKSKLTEEMNNNSYQLIIHAAAVSDFSVERHPGKISSDQDEFFLKFKKNPKLINEFKKRQPSAQLIGFKLTSGATDEFIQNKIRSLFTEAQCDLVIHNDWNNLAKSHRDFTVYQSSEKIVAKHIAHVDGLVQIIFQFIHQKHKEVV